jgi:hypothetical protein
MTALNTERKETVKKYILSTVCADGYEVTEPTTNAGRVEFISLTFDSEYGWAVERYGKKGALKEWIQGLPSSLNIDFMNHKIIDICKQWGLLTDESDDEEIDDMLSDWFNMIATELNEMIEGVNIPED